MKGELPWRQTIDPAVYEQRKPDERDRWARESFTFRRMRRANIWSFSIALAVAAVMVAMWMWPSALGQSGVKLSGRAPPVPPPQASARRKPCSPRRASFLLRCMPDRSLRAPCCRSGSATVGLGGARKLSDSAAFNSGLA